LNCNTEQVISLMTTTLFFICCITKMVSSTTSLSYSENIRQQRLGSFWWSPFFFLPPTTWRTQAAHIWLSFPRCVFFNPMLSAYEFNHASLHPQHELKNGCLLRQLFLIVKKTTTYGSKNDQFSQLDPKASTIESHVGLLLFSVCLNRYSIQWNDIV
jgi:hypothetical protein